MKKSLLIIMIFCYSVITIGQIPAHNGIKSSYFRYLGSLPTALLTGFPEECDDRAYNVLAIEDEFEGNMLDETIWSTRYLDFSKPSDRILFHNNSGSFERQIYREKNVTVDNGTLRLTCVEENPADIYQNEEGEEPFYLESDWSSGMVRSKEKYTHGKFEIRCKVPIADGAWPAFWIIGFDEIDVFEYFGSQPEVNYTVAHTYHHDSKVPTKNTTSNDLLLPSSSNWKTYTCIWTPYELTMLVDGVKVWSTYRLYRVIKKRTFNNPHENKVEWSFNGLNCEESHEIQEARTYSVNGQVITEAIYENTAFPLHSGRVIANYALLGLRNQEYSQYNMTFPSDFLIDYIKVYQQGCDFNIMGKENICTSDNVTYNLSVPANEIIWSTSDNLEITSDPTGNFVTVSPADGVTNGFGKIYATIADDPNCFIEKDVSIGAPPSSTNVFYDAELVCDGGGINLTVGGNYPPETTFDWEFSNNFGLSVFEYSSGKNTLINVFGVALYSGNTTINYTVTISNDCGSTEISGAIFIEQCEDIFRKPLIITPNPSDQYITVSFEGIDESKVLNQNINLYIVSNSFGLEKIININQIESLIDISELPEGLHRVVVTIDEVDYTESFIISRN